MKRHEAVVKYLSERGRAGGLARAKALSKEQRTALAKKAARARWGRRGA